MALCFSNHCNPLSAIKHLLKKTLADLRRILAITTREVPGDFAPRTKNNFSDLKVSFTRTKPINHLGGRLRVELWSLDYALIYFGCLGAVTQNIFSENSFFENLQFAI